ncbi:MAG: HD domain-containing protein [Candidatus Micrarchaeia archaeon]|jgi:3'-5' exoribonuclease
MERQTVNEILEKAEKTQIPINSTFAIVERTPLTDYKSGKPGAWFNLLLGDKTGKIKLKCWGGLDKSKTQCLYEKLDVGRVISVTGSAAFDSYDDDIIVTAKEEGLCEVSEFNPKDFLKESSRDVNQLMLELDAFREEVTDPDLKAILAEFYKDENTRKKLIYSPGAMFYHHDYVGGLAEHICSVTKICKLLCEEYPNLNRDLLITGALLHDIGKIQEYRVKGLAFEYDPDSAYIGHIFTCEKELSKLINKLPEFPKEYSNELRHMIVSHHGTPDMGSPVKPGFIEAEALHLADLTDSQVSKFSIATENFKLTDSGKQNKVLDRRIIRGNKK